MAYRVWDGFCDDALATGKESADWKSEWARYYRETAER
jgi:hypothetical protein